MKNGQVGKIKSERPAAARFNGMKCEFVRDVEEGDPAFVDSDAQVVVRIEGADLYFYASEVEDSELKPGERHPGDRRIDQTSPDFAHPTANTNTGAPPVGELGHDADGNVPKEVPGRVLQPEPTAPNPETGTLRAGAARSSEDNPPPDGMPRHAPVRPGAEPGPTAAEVQRDKDRNNR